MGGAIFIRSGELSLRRSSFSQNAATGLKSSSYLNAQETDGQGLGGAIFALDTTVNPNGNNQGMPEMLPLVALENVQMSGNSASGNLSKVVQGELRSNKKYNNSAVYGSTLSGTIQARPQKDINGDYKSDFVQRDLATGQANIALFGDGGFAQSLDLGPSIRDKNWEIKGSGRFSSNDNSSLVWRNKATGQNLLWSMDGLSVSQSIELDSVTDRNWDIRGVDDFDADGYADILWYNSVSQQGVVWFMDKAEINSKAIVSRPESGTVILKSESYNADVA